MCVSGYNSVPTDITETAEGLSRNISGIDKAVYFGSK